MTTKCPSCNTEFDCAPGKYQCVCGTKFLIASDGSVVSLDDESSTPSSQTHSGQESLDETMPGRRARIGKTDGQFETGDLVLGRYEVLAKLGRGGMGVVYRCFDKTGGVEVALKALPPELSQNDIEMEDIRENFRLVYRLHHPNIANCNTLEKDDSNGNYYLVMECVEGEDLRRWIRRKRREGDLTLEMVLPIIRQVASALDYAHKQKIVHRDIKPGNIMLDAEGNVKVLDFGLAAQIHSSMTHVSMTYQGTSGTAPYMAPEQWRGRHQGAAADQYALAVMTYEMLAGYLPFESTDAAVLQQAVLTQDPEPIAFLPKHAQAAIERAMSKDPAHRFASCSDFVDALDGKAAPDVLVAAVVPGVPTTPVAPASSRGEYVTPSSAPAEPRRQDAGKRKKRMLFGLFAGVLLVFLVISAFVMNEYVRTFRRIASSESEDDRSEEPFVRTPEPEQTVDLSDDTEPWIREQVSEPTASPFGGTEQRVQIPPGDKTIVLPGNVKLELVKVEADSFVMSTNDGENLGDEVPHRAILTKDFYIGRTEVTQAQWRGVMGSNPSNFKGNDLPVEKVTWNEAMEFCGKLNSTGKAPNGWKFSLPTETQWEFAARGGNKSKGYKYSGSDDVGEVAWYHDNSGSKTHPVAQKKANELGLYDMSGNVLEWCLDDWNGDSSKLTTEFTRGNDQWYSSRVLRGGGWFYGAGSCRSGYRFHHDPGDRIIWLGFRVALVPADGYGSDREASPANAMPQEQKTEQTIVSSGETQQQQTQKRPADRTISLSGGVKLDLMKVAAGTFTMSSKDGQNYSNEVSHRASLTKDFYIGQTEVTQAQWKAVMGNNPSNVKGNDLPVTSVSWNDAMSFCEKLNGMGKAPSGWKFTLPTETQWEYAARGGNKSKGYKYSGSDNADEVAWHTGNSGGKAHPAGLKTTNELGLYDMSGNVWEWCLDDWNDDSSKLSAEFTRGNVQGRTNRANRGGSWFNGARDARSAGRNSYSPDRRADGLGFRVALVPADGYGSDREASPANAMPQEQKTGQTAVSSGGTPQQQTRKRPADRRSRSPAA